MRIEAAKQSVAEMPMTPRVQARLRETGRLRSTHYSTRIEGNRLTLDQASRVILDNAHFQGRQRDENEVLGYYRALDELDALVARNAAVTERVVRMLHALVIAGRHGKVKPTPYRTGQNVIRDSRSGAIVYLPPEAKDVPVLMADLTHWIENSANGELPCPLRAAIVHYQFATIHPYYDGNGRTARLLTTLVLHLGGYGLKGFYALEEYYAQDLAAYYDAIAIGPSHNYYLGRADADITTFVEYFCFGMADAFESVRRQAQEEGRSGKADRAAELRKLDTRQRRVLSLLQKFESITAAQVAKTLEIPSRTARYACQLWVSQGFLVVLDPSKKARRYGPSAAISKLVS